MQPRAVPIASPAPSASGAGRPAFAASSTATYCATEAVAAKEMSIPPETKHDEQAHRHDRLHRIGLEQIDDVGEGQEPRRRDAEHRADDEDDGQEPDFGAALEAGEGGGGGHRLA